MRYYVRTVSEHEKKLEKTRFPKKYYDLNRPYLLHENNDQHLAEAAIEPIYCEIMDKRPDIGDFIPSPVLIRDSSTKQFWIWNTCFWERISDEWVTAKVRKNLSHLRRTKDDVPLNLSKYRVSNIMEAVYTLCDTVLPDPPRFCWINMEPWTVTADDLDAWGRPTVVWPVREEDMILFEDCFIVRSQPEPREKFPITPWLFFTEKPPYKHSLELERQLVAAPPTDGSVRSFIVNRCILGSGHSIVKEILRTAYKPNVNAMTFAKELLQEFPSIKQARIRINGQRERIYRGIGLKPLIAPLDHGPITPKNA